ncbi:MAG TPA: metallophosphoesterase [Lacipirellula sp.]
MSKHNTGAPITRREALRRTLVFSTGAWAASQFGSLQAGEPRTDFGEKGIHLLALGDYGMRGNEGQRSVADRMATFARSLGAPLTGVLAIGDNFYRKITPNRFETDFEQMYSQQDLACPFYACAGNHDYGTALYDFQQGKLQMQLDYAANNPQSRWKFPAKWYSVELPSPEEPLVKIVTLDGSYWPGALTPREKVDQRRWLEAELKKPTKAPWLWVVNHYPLFSDTADRGDNKTLIREWGPILQDHPVSLCLAGHDHTLQHLRVEGYSADFVVSGAGGARLYDVHPSERGFCNNQCFGFAHLYASPERMELQFINAAGERLHGYTRDRQGKVEVRT